MAMQLRHDAGEALTFCVGQSVCGEPIQCWCPVHRGEYSHLVLAWYSEDTQGVPGCVDLAGLQLHQPGALDS